MPERDRHRHRFEERRRDGDARRARDRVLVRHLRAEPRRGPRRRLLREPAADRDRAVRRPTRRELLPAARRKRSRACLSDLVRIFGGMSIKVTQLARRRARAPARSPSARSTASTSATGKVIEGADTVLTFEPHPLERPPPGGRAQADHAVRRQARRDRGARRRGDRRDPVRPRVLASSRRRTSSRSSWSRRSAPTAVSVGENFRFGAQGQGRPGDARRARRVRRPASSRSSRLTARPSRRRGSGRWSPPATSRARCAASARRSCSRARSSAATSGAARSASRRRTSPRSATGRARPRRLRGLRRRPARRGERGREADLRDRARAPGRDLHHRPGRRPLRADRCGSRSSPGCAASSASRRRGPHRADAPATSRRRESSALLSLGLSYALAPA